MRVINKNRIKFNQITKKKTPVLPVCNFLNNCSTNEKINHIDHIVWINLESSINRFHAMNILLNSLTIPHTRIQAVDGKEENFILQCKSLHRKITPLEMACCLSHIKAIHTLKSLPGQFFMVCEDDISLENLCFFDITLFDIIKNAPYFDILMIYHSYPNDLKNEYNDWVEFEIKNNIQIAGAVCYIIRKSCVKNFPSFDIHNLPPNFDVADRYIFRQVKTIVYKYNFISTQCKDSTIHDDHLKNHKQWKENELNIIKKNLTVLNRRYKSCNIYFHFEASLYQDILKNFAKHRLVHEISDADIIIYHEDDDNFFEYNQKYNILIKSSQQTYLHPYNCILNADSELIIPLDKYLKCANWLIAN